MLNPESMPQINLGSFLFLYIIFFGFFIYNMLYIIRDVFGIEVRII